MVFACNSTCPCSEQTVSRKNALGLLCDDFFFSLSISLLSFLIFCVALLLHDSQTYLLEPCVELWMLDSYACDNSSCTLHFPPNIIPFSCHSLWKQLLYISKEYASNSNTKMIQSGKANVKCSNKRRAKSTTIYKKR